MDSSGVIEEVEALFKKLQDLPDGIRQKALSTIQERLPNFSPVSENPDGSDSRPKLKRGRPPKRALLAEQEISTVTTHSSTTSDWSEDDEIVINSVQTSRGRNTKRISLASLLKTGRRYNSSRKYRSRKKPKMELKSDSVVVPVIKMEILEEEETENTYEESNQSTCSVQAKEERVSDTEIEQHEIIAEEVEEIQPDSIEELNQVEDVENVNEDVPCLQAEKEDNQENTEELTSPKEASAKSPTKRGLSIRNRSHRTVPNSGKSSYKCPECGKTFAQSSGLHLHLKRHRNERNYECNDCPYKAFTKIDLVRHVTIHTGERNHICQYCGKAYAKDSTLRDHVIAMHERKLKYVCNQCGFATHRANNLRVHVRMRHHGEYNNHVCPVCQASIKQKSAFLEHMRSHTGERPYRCETCPAAFACMARLNVHRSSVHGERQFRCEYCKKCFQTKHHLLRHEAVHTKARPYGCPFCSYACNTQGNMAKHVRTIHNMPDYSYRKFKELQENGGHPKPLDPDWVEKGNRLTEQYLSELSEKIGRPITVEELWRRQQELKKNKMNRVTKERTSRRGSEHSYHSRMANRRKAVEERPAIVEEGGGLFEDPVTLSEKENSEVVAHEQDEVLESEEGKVGEQNRERGDDVEEQVEEEEEEEEKHPSVYQWLANSGSIQLCLETNELQVYTGDATRELPKDAEDQVEMIQGYMNEEGHFVRFNDNIVVNEDDSTVVVIINSDEMQEIHQVMPHSEIEDHSVVVSSSPILDNSISDTSQHTNHRYILVKQQS